MQNLNTVPLSALRAIEAIARNGNLAGAAHELGVTAGALSQRLTKAEDALGQTLFLRQSTGLKPTALCQDIAPRLTRAIEELSAVVSHIKAPSGGMLTLSVAPIFASRWLIWRIKRFNQENPDINLRVSPTHKVIDLDHSDVDIGIRVGSAEALGAGAYKLLDQRVFPVCSPELAAQLHGLDDLKGLPIIRENDALYGWQDWLEDRDLKVSDLHEGPIYADASLCFDAAMSGQGVFMAWETLACDALDRGHVVAPFKGRAQTNARYWFATAEHAAQNPNVLKFRTWLEDELACSVAFWQEGVV